MITSTAGETNIAETQNIKMPACPVNIMLTVQLFQKLIISNPRYLE